MTVADRQGLAGLTMRAVADELGVAPMSLYHHIADKDDLLQDVADAAMADYPSHLPGSSWEERLSNAVREFRAALLRHPSLGQIYADRPISGVNVYRYLNMTIEILLDTGFEPEPAVDAFTALSTYTVGATLFEISRIAGAAPPSADQLRIERLQRAAEHGYSAIATVAPFMIVRGTPAQFEYGLGHLIDGLRSDLAASTTAKPRRRRTPKAAR